MSLNVTCSNCSWVVSTTNQDHAAFDQREYTVHLVPTPSLRKESIIGMASVLNISVAEARKQADQSLAITSGISASEAIRLRKEFSLRGIEVAFTPPLPWKDDGTAQGRERNGDE